MGTVFDLIITEAEEMEDHLRGMRRDLHKYPETGWTEMRTASKIAGELKRMGMDEILTGRAVCREDARMGVADEDTLRKHYERAASQGADPEFLPETEGGFTGVIGILKYGPGPVIAFRFDMDALPVTECKEKDHLPFAEGFASVNEGVMHACGHDGNVTVGLGTARLLCSLREYLHGTVKFIFQPAEEGLRGARSIAEAGHLDDVDYVFASHMGDIREIGPGFAREDGCERKYSLGVDDNLTLASTKMDVYFYGKASHAGIAPQNGRNALTAAACAVQNLYGIPRNGEADTRINVGTLHAGTGRNIICDHAKMEMEVRASTTEASRYMENCAENVIKGAALMYGCDYEIRICGAATNSANTPDLMERVQRISQEKLRLACPDTGKGLHGGSEDYSFFADAVKAHGGQSCYFMNYSPCRGMLHNETFDFDEGALVNGVKAFSSIAADLLA